MCFFRENYEHLVELNGPDERLSDHSDKYSHIYMYNNENGDVSSTKKKHIQQGLYLNGPTKTTATSTHIFFVSCVGFHVYPPPTTPPEPAPPDHMNMRHSKRGPILSASQTSLDEITCK